MTRAVAIIALLALLRAAPLAAQVSTQDPARLGPTIAIGGTPVIEPRTIAIASASTADAIEPEITTRLVGGAGYDLVCVYTNTTEAAKPLARLTIGALALGPDIQYLNVHRGSALLDARHSSYTNQAWRYPSEAYSPATALMNDRFAVGVSLLYPITEYKHDVLVGVNRPGGVFQGPDGAQSWTVTFDLSQPPYANQHTALAHPAALEPGESRTYTVAVRVMERTSLPASPTDAQDWLETLLPYRDHFQKDFGPVSYTRNPAAVLAFEAANGSAISASNPRGLLGDNTSRPDLVGFGPLIDRIRAHAGFSRVMLWAPSGLYSRHREFNFPPHFTLGWKSSPLMNSTHTRFRQLQPAGIQLGLWWGRSVQHASAWEPAQLEPLDLTNRDHLRTIADQLALAHSAGATLIGLDDLSHWTMPVWEQRRFIRALRGTYPSMTFVAEPMCADLIHADAPAFSVAYTAPPGGKQEADFHRLTTPNYLADFLLPGHESWAYFRYSEITGIRPGNISPARVQSDAARLASLGFVPVMVSAHALTDPALATAGRTWLTTVPEHLRQAAPTAPTQPGAPATGTTESTADP